MVTPFKRPPSQRNFQVHYFLTEGGSTREAVMRFGISQTRVRQLERQVLAWAAEVLPAESEAELAGLVRVAESVASDRLEHFYQETMAQWRRKHEPKFLNLALRVTMASAKLAGRAYQIGAAEADLLEGAEEDGDESGGSDQRAERPPARRVESSAQASGPTPAADVSHRTPPHRDCSEKSRASAEAHGVHVLEQVATRPPPGKLERLLAGENRPSEEQSLRLRTLLSPPANATGGSLGMTAADLNLSVDDVLQRQERKRRKAK